MEHTIARWASYRCAKYLRIVYHTFKVNDVIMLYARGEAEHFGRPPPLDETLILLCFTRCCYITIFEQLSAMCD